MTMGMKILDRHIAQTVTQSCLLVMSVLLSAFTLLVFVEDLGDVGRGQYRLLDSCVYMALTLPRRVVDLAPTTALLGSLIGLGRLASGNELLTMQAGGVSPFRIAGAVLKTGALLMLAVLMLEEFVAPPADQLGLIQRNQAISDTGALQTERGFWSRDQRHVVNVRRVLHGKIPADIDIYEFDERGVLRTFTQAANANTEDPRGWLLSGVQQKVIGQGDVTARQLPSLLWESFLTLEQIGLLVFPAETLSISDLYHYIAYLRGTGHSVEIYELSFWQKISMPFSTGAMVLVAISFVFGPLRVATTGKRILAGAMTAMAFYLISKMIGHLAIVYDLNPVLTTMGPVAIFLALALWLFWRIR